MGKSSIHLKEVFIHRYKFITEPPSSSSAAKIARSEEI